LGGFAEWGVHPGGEASLAVAGHHVLTSGLALLPVTRMAGCMADRCHDDAFSTDDTTSQK
jgi:hypothetical protein